MYVLHFVGLKILLNEVSKPSFGVGVKIGITCRTSADMFLASDGARGFFSDCIITSTQEAKSEMVGFKMNHFSAK